MSGFFFFFFFFFFVAHLRKDHALLARLQLGQLLKGACLGGGRDL